MKNILNIMRSDLVAMNAKKFSLGKLYLAAFIICIIAGLLFPYLLLPFLLAFCFLTVPSFIDVEDRNEGDMTFSILPVTRRENVIARYALITIILTIIGATSLLVVALSDLAASSDAASSGDIFSQLLDLDLDETGFISILVCGITAVALIFSASQLGSFFKYGKNKNGKSALRFLLILFIIWLAAGAVLIIETSSMEVKILSSALSIVANLLLVLVSPCNGALLCGFMLMIAYGFVFYKMACSVLDYETREL